MTVGVYFKIVGGGGQWGEVHMKPLHVGNLKAGNRHTGASLYHPIFIGLKMP